jgi:hypothetical protein
MPVKFKLPQKSKILRYESTWYVTNIYPQKDDELIVNYDVTATLGTPENRDIFPLIGKKTHIVTEQEDGQVCYGATVIKEIGKKIEVKWLFKERDD